MLTGLPFRHSHSHNLLKNSCCDVMKRIVKVRNKYVLYELRHSYVKFVTDEY